MNSLRSIFGRDCTTIFMGSPACRNYTTNRAHILHAQNKASIGSGRPATSSNGLKNASIDFCCSQFCHRFSTRSGFARGRIAKLSAKIDVGKKNFSKGQAFQVVVNSKPVTKIGRHSEKVLTVLRPILVFLVRTKVEMITNYDNSAGVFAFKDL